ncbi:Dcp2, box A domain-containing protein [Lipomyces japonicus]|uniref:Dcp2, box A domain-containing protein n=1 Tax=Lipomyces japonicus TaxID=56871 RepID=UPI0034CE378B
MPALHSAFSFANSTLDQVLDDLSVRFIINCPPEELASRVCFQVEEAHWFYEDFVRTENASLPSMKLRDFTATIFQHCPLLRKWSATHEQAYENFQTYKTRIPVRGAILLNHDMTKCLLVKGWKASSSWGFPKGKINKAETDQACAIREVIEETGYDVTPLLNANEFITATVREQNLKLFVVRDVPLDTIFITQTRKEISKIAWVDLNSLPTYAKSSKRKVQGANKYYLVVPFMLPLREWINKHNPQQQQQQQQQQSKDLKKKSKKSSNINKNGDNKKQDLAELEKQFLAQFPNINMKYQVHEPVPQAQPQQPHQPQHDSQQEYVDPAKTILALLKKTPIKY